MKVDPATFRLVVAGLIVLALGSVIAAVVLVNGDHDAGQAWTLATAATTGLVGLLVNPGTEVADGFDPGGAAVDGYRAATRDLHELDT